MNDPAATSGVPASAIGDRRGTQLHIALLGRNGFGGPCLPREIHLQVLAFGHLSQAKNAA